MLQAEGEKFKVAAKKGGRKAKTTPEAMEFLLKLLSNGDACLFLVAAEKGLLLGFAESTLRRAAAKLDELGKITRYDVPPDTRIWLKLDAPQIQKAPRRDGLTNRTGLP